MEILRQRKKKKIFFAHFPHLKYKEPETKANKGLFCV